MFGRTEHKTRYENGAARTSSRRKQRDKWISLIPNHHEGFISWDDFERLQKMLADNNIIRGKGAAREGIALLPGLLHCRRCGHKLVVYYGGANNNVPRYCCHRGYLDNGEPKCISFGGLPIDRAISEQVLRVAEPAAMEAAVLAHQQESDHREEVLQALQREREAARYEATRAQRQFDAADPDNRLVTDELERRWNVALERVAEVEDRIQQHETHHASHQQVGIEEFASLASDLESIWSNRDADIRLKKRIVRELIQDIVVDVDQEASDVVLVIHWIGGCTRNFVSRVVVVAKPPRPT